MWVGMDLRGFTRDLAVGCGLWAVGCGLYLRPGIWDIGIGDMGIWDMGDGIWEMERVRWEMGKERKRWEMGRCEAKNMQNGNQKG